MHKVWILATAILAAFTAPASAEVVNASPSTFTLRSETTLDVAPDDVWAAIARPERWWNPSHTFSGDARRLRLDRRAGGCFCEIWSDGQSVEHARVVLVTEYDGARTLRLNGALGPLQDMGAVGILTYVVAEDPAGAKITMTYRVSGDASLALDALAPAVHGVLNEQFGRLVRYVGGERLN